MFDVASPTAPLAAKLTADQAVAIVATWFDLSPTRRRDLASAISSAAKLLGLPRGAVLLTPAALRASLVSRSASTFGIEEGRMRNIVSCLRTVLRRLDVIDDAATPLTPNWAEHMALMPERKRPGLIGFARYCSVNGVAPPQVTNEVLEAFEKWLEERTLTARPAKGAGAVRAAWNKAAGSIACWPQIKLQTLAQRSQYILPLDAFPSSFKDDLHRFTSRLGTQSIDDIFDEIAPSANVTQKPRSRPSRPISVRLRADHCRWAASALVASGVALEDVTSLTTLVRDINTVKRTLRCVYEKSGSRPSAAGGHVIDVLRMIAKYHASDVERPSDIGTLLAAARNKMGLKYVGMTDKNRRQIRLMMDPAHEARLLALPDALMKAARKLRANKPKQAASIAIRAIAIDLLMFCPVRLSNLIGIQLNQHLRRANPPRGPITDLCFAAHEVKNYRVLDMPVPPSTAALIEEWTDRFRPAMAAPGCTYLFPGRGNRSITPQGMRNAIRQATEKHVGVVLTPHQFRHLAAHLHLNENPGHYEEVSHLLGDDPKTIRESYSGIETTASVNRYGALINERRKALRSSKGRSQPANGTAAMPLTSARPAKTKKAAKPNPTSPKKPTKPKGGK